MNLHGTPELFCFDGEEELVSRGREQRLMGWWVMCLSSKREDLHLDHPSTHVKKLGTVGPAWSPGATGR